MLTNEQQEQRRQLAAQLDQTPLMETIRALQRESAVLHIALDNPTTPDVSQKFQLANLAEHLATLSDELQEIVVDFFFTQAKAVN